MSKKNTVLFVAPYFPPHSGGLERYLYELVSRFDASKWSVKVLTTSEHGTFQKEKLGNVAVYRLPVQMKVSNTPFSFSWFRAVRKLLRELHPDVINIHMPVPGLGDIVALLAKRSVPLVVTYHGNSMKKGVPVLDVLVWIYENTFLRYILGRAAHVVCASDSIREGFLKRYERKSSTVTPGVNIEQFYPSDTKPKKHSILFVGGLGTGEEHKGLHTLLRALVKVKKKYQDVQLTVVGQGDKESQYKKIVHELGLSKHVVFKGYLTGVALADEYRNAALFALPTENESFGMVLAEAMATGIPVVSTKVGGVPLLVEHGKTGLLVEPKQDGAIARAICTLFGDNEKAARFGKEGRCVVEERYSWNERVTAYERVFTCHLAHQRTVAHVVGYYPPHLGGMEVVAQELAREQAKSGTCVRVYTSNIGAESYPAVSVEGNATVHRLKSIDVAHTPVMWALPIRLLGLPKQSLLHVHLAQVGAPEIALLVAKLKRIPLVYHFHLDVEPSGILGPVFLLYKKYILGFVLRRANAVLVFSDEQKDFMHRTYKVHSNKIHIVPNGVGMEYFQKVEEVQDISSQLRLLYVGRLSVQKRVDLLVLAMKKLSKIATLTIVGDGEDREALELLVKNECIQNVTFTGRKNPQEVRKYHRDADVFITASEKEGMPISVLEAMAAGLPVVASDVVGLRELVSDVGLLVQERTHEAFADAVMSLTTKQLKEMKQKSVVCAQQYTWKQVSDNCEAVYRQL